MYIVRCTQGEGNLAIPFIGWIKVKKGSILSRLLKKVRLLTHPTLARRDAPFPGKTAGESKPEA